MESAFAESQVRDHQTDKTKSKGKTSISSYAESLSGWIFFRSIFLNQSDEFEVTTEFSAAFSFSFFSSKFLCQSKAFSRR